MTSDPLSKFGEEKAERMRVAGLRMAAHKGGRFFSSSNCPVDGCNETDLHMHYVCPSCGILDGVSPDCIRCRARESIIATLESLDRLIQALRFRVVVLFVVVMVLATISTINI